MIIPEEENTTKVNHLASRLLELIKTQDKINIAYPITKTEFRQHDHDDTVIQAEVVEAVASTGCCDTS